MKKRAIRVFDGSAACHSCGELYCHNVVVVNNKDETFFSRTRTGGRKIYTGLEATMKKEIIIFMNVQLAFFLLSDLTMLTIP